MPGGISETCGCGSKGHGLVMDLNAYLFPSSPLFPGYDLTHGLTCTNAVTSVGALLFYKKNSVFIRNEAMEELCGSCGKAPRRPPAQAPALSRLMWDRVNVSSFLSPLCPYLEEKRKALSSYLLPAPTDADIGGVSRIYVVNSPKWNTAFRADPSALQSCVLHVYSVVSQRKAPFSSDIFYFIFPDLFPWDFENMNIYYGSTAEDPKASGVLWFNFLRGILFCCGSWCESIYGPWMPSSGGKASSSLLVTLSSLAKFTRKITLKLAADHFCALFVVKSESVKNTFYMAGHTNRKAIWCFTVL